MSCSAEKLEIQKRYREKNKEAINARKRITEVKNPDAVRAHDRERYWRNVDAKRAAARARYQADPERFRAQAKAYRTADPEKAREAVRACHRRNPQQRMWSVSRIRARDKGFAFEITPKDIVIPECCPIFGVVLVRHFGGHKGKEGANHPTVDRIDPSKGYIPGNIWVISYRANAIKNDATPAELRQIADAVERKLKESEFEL